MYSIGINKSKLVLKYIMYMYICVHICVYIQNTHMYGYNQNYPNIIGSNFIMAILVNAAAGNRGRTPRRITGDLLRA